MFDADSCVGVFKKDFWWKLRVTAVSVPKLSLVLEHGANVRSVFRVKTETQLNDFKIVRVKSEGQLYNLYMEMNVTEISYRLV